MNAPYSEPRLPGLLATLSSLLRSATCKLPSKWGCTSIRWNKNFRHGSNVEQSRLTNSDEGRKTKDEIYAQVPSSTVLRPSSTGAKVSNCFQPILNHSKLHESEERLRLLIESAGDIIFVQNLDGEYRYYNSAPLYGLSSDEVLGKTSYDLFDAKTAARLADIHRQVVASGQSATTEMELVWRDKCLYFNFHIYPLKDGAGNITTIATIARNVTESKRLKGLLPMCAWCGKKIRDEQGNWQRVDAYLHTHTDAKISHTLCPDCFEKTMASLPESP